MPETTENGKLAGHSAATMVGGKRVSQPRNRNDSNGSSSNRKDSSMESNSSDEKVEQTSPTTQANSVGAIVDGVPIKLEDAYPAEAVKKYHDKPLPTHTKDRSKPHCTANNNLFQPRRQ